MKTSTIVRGKTKMAKRLANLLFGVVISAGICVGASALAEDEQSLENYLEQLDNWQSEEILEREDVREKLASESPELFAILTRDGEGKFHAYLVWRNARTNEVVFTVMPMGWLCDIFKIKWACDLRGNS